MRWPTAVILVLIALVLAPMWYVAMQGPGPAEPVELDEEVTDIRPQEEVVDTPNELSPSQVGVIVWVALFVLLGVLTAAHRFMASGPRSAAGVRGRPAADGGRPADGDQPVDVPDWLVADDRQVVAYRAAPESTTGLAVMAVLTALSVAFSALFTWEYLGLARTQYFGAYAAGMFFSLAGLTIGYYAWFLAHVEVAEPRGHDQ